MLLKKNMLLTYHVFYFCNIYIYLFHDIYTIIQFILHDCFKLKVQCIFILIIQTSIRNSLYIPHFIQNYRTLFFFCGEFTCGEQVESMKYPHRAQAMLNDNYLTCRLYLHLHLWCVRHVHHVNCKLYVPANQRQTPHVHY